MQPDDASAELCSTQPGDVAADFFRNIASLLVVCFASWKVAAFAQKLSLPRGSGFLLTGVTRTAHQLASARPSTTTEACARHLRHGVHCTREAECFLPTHPSARLEMRQMLAGPFLDSVQSAYDPATSRTMIKGVTCKYVILPVSSSKLYMFFPVRGHTSAHPATHLARFTFAKSCADLSHARRMCIQASPKQRGYPSLLMPCSLSQVNYICMSFIAYATGSELVYSRYRKLLKKMAIITMMTSLAINVVVSAVLQVQPIAHHLLSLSCQHR